MQTNRNGRSSPATLLPMLLLIPLYYIIREPITWLMFHGHVGARTVGEIQNVFLVAKQIIREHDTFLGHPGCRIEAEASEGGHVLWCTLPRTS